MRISTLALPASLALLLASGTSFADRYTDQSRSQEATAVKSPTASVVSTGYATGGRGPDLLHARRGVATEKAEFAVMEMPTARDDRPHTFYRGGRAVDYLIR